LSGGFQGNQVQANLLIVIPAQELVREFGISPFLVTPAQAGVQQLIEKPGLSLRVTFGSPLPRE